MSAPAGQDELTYIARRLGWADTTGDWWNDGLCAQTDPEAFFPETGESTREAKAMCARCPVATECLEDALRRDERFGIWGGLSTRERQRVKRERAHAGGAEQEPPR